MEWCSSGFGNCLPCSMTARFRTKDQEPRTKDSLPCILHGSGFAKDRYLDFAGIGQLLLDGPRDVAADLGRLLVAEPLGVGDDPDFPARLDGIGLIDAREAAG